MFDVVENFDLVDCFELFVVDSAVGWAWASGIPQVVARPERPELVRDPVLRHFCVGYANEVAGGCIRLYDF
jgi:hypothetical protein